MTEQLSPITPPPELVQQWLGEYFGTTVSGEISDVEHVLATRAARWAADKELEACCEWLRGNWPGIPTDKLRTARRHRPPSLKELALKELESIMDELHEATDSAFTASAIRRALEQLDD